MTTDVITVTPETPVRDIAKLLYTRRISGVPVVDPDRAVIGLRQGHQAAQSGRSSGKGPKVSSIVSVCRPPSTASISS